MGSPNTLCLVAVRSVLSHRCHLSWLAAAGSVFLFAGIMGTFADDGDDQEWTWGSQLLIHESLLFRFNSFSIIGFRHLYRGGVIYRVNGSVHVWFWNLHSRGERGKWGRECKFQNKSHRTFDSRINFTPVLLGGGLAGYLVKHREFIEKIYKFKNKQREEKIPAPNEPPRRTTMATTTLNWPCLSRDFNFL